MIRLHVAAGVESGLLVVPYRRYTGWVCVADRAEWYRHAAFPTVQELGVAQELDERLRVVVGDPDAGEHRHRASVPGRQRLRFQRG